MSDDFDDLTSFDAKLASFRPAAYPTPQAVQFAVGVEAGRRLAARRYRLSLAVMLLVCVATSGLALQQNLRSVRMRDSLAALQAKRHSADRLLASDATKVGSTVRSPMANDVPPTDRTQSHASVIGKVSDKPTSSLRRHGDVKTLSHRAGLRDDEVRMYASIDRVTAVDRIVMDGTVMVRGSSVREATMTLQTSRSHSWDF